MAKRSVARSRRQSSFQSPALAIAREVPGVRTGPLPDFIEPALATLAPKPPSGAKWVHEIKFDGYRAQLHKRDHASKMFTRQGYNWGSFPQHRCRFSPDRRGFILSGAMSH